jgi:hypothetical protein
MIPPPLSFSLSLSRPARLGRHDPADMTRQALPGRHDPAGTIQPALPAGTIQQAATDASLVSTCDGGLVGSGQAGGSPPPQGPARPGAYLQ